MKASTLAIGAATKRPAHFGFTYLANKVAPTMVPPPITNFNNS